MLNREIYQKDPATRKLLNDGVASVNDDTTASALAVLRYELETFVCSGQYEQGLVRILETFLSNINQAQQPAVWVSGFFGSGKSHLVKMLRALWTDTRFPDGATARGIAHLPQSVRDCFRELDAQGQRHGGLHAASGTLGAGASGSVRLTLLGIIFKSADLPSNYQEAKFVLWMKQQNIYDSVRAHVEQAGHNWDYELDCFYISDAIHEALAKERPNTFSSQIDCSSILGTQFPEVQDISMEEMLKSIRQALVRNGKFPLTLVVLDEIQQYIGESSQRSIDIQEMVEACCKNFSGKLVFIGTGQTAVTGTSNLKRLEGRFTVRIELSDADVDAVIRHVILDKKPSAKQEINSTMEQNLGEISRHLTSTSIGHRQEDVDDFVMDYPLLPVRRRFWENCLRVLDQTGTDSQLRNQLSLVYRAIRTNLDAPLGSVIAADFLFFDSTDKMLQSNTLPRRIFEKTARWIRGSEEERLTARACALVFLINKLADRNREIGIQANVNTIADLLVEDLSQGSAHLRSQLPGLLDNCELLMKIGSVYRTQTEESAAWNDDFQNEYAILSSTLHRIDTDRDDRIRRKVNEIIRGIQLLQGKTKVPRQLLTHFAEQLPNDANTRLYVWVRDGWSISEKAFISEARQAGNDSPTIFVFIPKRSADDLRHYLINFKAASATLDKRGIPNTADGTEARSAMETRKQVAESKIQELLDEAFSGIRVFQGGGTEITGNDVKSMLSEAAEKSLKRLYPSFSVADDNGWSKVYENAHKGAPDALKAVGYEGETAQNQVCKTILSILGGGKNGTDIRTHFESAPFGWSRDAIDGGIQVLLVSGLVRATDERRPNIAPSELERKAIGKTLFRIESITITTPQRIQIRKLLQKLSFRANQGEELSVVPGFLQKMLELAGQAGGEAPKPVLPDISHIRDLQRLAGNELLFALFNMREQLAQNIDDWTNLAKSIEKRWQEWLQLKRLAKHAVDLSKVQDTLGQISILEEQRQLLEKHDPLPPLTDQLTQALREELLSLKDRYDSTYSARMEELKTDSNWQKLAPEQKNDLLSAQMLQESAKPTISLESSEDVLTTLERYPLTTLGDRIAALPGRFEAVAHEAAELCEPKTQFIHVSRRILKSSDDVDEWLREVGQKLKDALPNGPVMIR